MGAPIWWLVHGVPAHFVYLLDGIGVAWLPMSGGPPPDWVREAFEHIRRGRPAWESRKAPQGWAFGDPYMGRPTQRLVGLDEVLPGPDWTEGDGLPEDEVTSRWRRCAWEGREFLVYGWYSDEVSIATLDPNVAESDRAWSSLKGPDYMWVRSVPTREVRMSIVPDRPRRWGESLG